MSEEEHWRAEDYEWDPSSLRATRINRTPSATRSGEQRLRLSLSTQASTDSMAMRTTYHLQASQR